KSKVGCSRRARSLTFGGFDYISINSSMRLLAAFLRISIYCSLFPSLNAEASPPCGSNMTPQEAYERAAAVFVGKVLAVTTLYNPPTKLSGKTPYHEVRLEVEKSWKLIDR